MKTDEEVIIEYRRADKSRRKYLWIYYRNLRSIFEEIEITDLLSQE